MQVEEFVYGVGHAEGVRLPANVTDTWVATEISKFDTADIPDMSAAQPESLHWISEYILNSVFDGALPSPQREYRFSFLRHAMVAYREHNMARYATLAFLESDERSFGRYFAAIHHWEQFVIAAWHALDTLRGAGVVGRLYEPGDGSTAEQLHGLYEETKDTESRVDTGETPPQGSLPVWLCNSGLRSVDAEITYAETGELLARIRDWAHVVEDPWQGHPYDGARID